jgi:hypothetical protein
METTPTKIEHESTGVDENEAATVAPVTTSTVKHEVESKITVDEDGPTGSEIKDSMENRSTQEQQLAAVFAQADGQSTVSETASKKFAPMSAEEIARLGSCEKIIRGGLETFVEVGWNLAIVRDKRLYRNEYNCFEEYVESKWKLTKQRAYQLIGAADKHRVLALRFDVSELPTDERAMRELMKVPPDKVAEVLGVVAAKGKVTAKHITEARDQVVPKKEKIAKAKKKPRVKIEAAIKAGEIWTEYLCASDVKAISEEQRNSLIAETRKAIDAIKEVLTAA